MGAQPNYFSAALSIGTSTSGALFAPGFDAVRLRILNTTAFDLYVKLGATGLTAATTTDLRIRACSDLPPFDIPPTSSLIAYTTSTAGASIFNVAALGG